MSKRREITLPLSNTQILNSLTQERIVGWLCHLVGMKHACMQEEGKPMLLDSGLKSTENHALEIGFEEGPGDPFFRSTCTSYEDPYDSCRRPLNRLLPDDNRHSFKLKKNNSSRWCSSTNTVTWACGRPQGVLGYMHVRSNLDDVDGKDDIIPSSLRLYPLRTRPYYVYGPYGEHVIEMYVVTMPWAAKLNTSRPGGNFFLTTYMMAYLSVTSQKTTTYMLWRPSRAQQVNKK